jgi:peptidylprolyl isomerase
MDRRLLTLLIFSGVLLVVVLAVVVARGGDDSDDESTSADSATKPTVEVPEGPPPPELVSEDLETGDGDEAKTGDAVSVQYVGVDYETGEEFDSSWERGEPFQFQLGGGQVIQGWDEGVVGMKVGGRRQLIIPPDLAYGKEGQPPSIGPNATLMFVIDLVSVD